MKNPSYFCLITFALILLCLTHSSNCMKSIHLKVLWSIFEENMDKILRDVYYVKSANHRFRILLFHPGTDQLLVPYFHTDKFDIRTVHIDDNVKAMDVRIEVYSGNSVRVFKNLVYEKDKIFTLPFHDTIPLPILSSAYDERIFNEPKRYFHFVLSALSVQIKPISIECVEPERGGNKKRVKKWKYEFGDKRDLKFQEVGCDIDKYTFKYESVQHKNKPKEHKRELLCGEPIYELGFVNQFDIVHDAAKDELNCQLNKNNGIQRSDQNQFTTESEASHPSDEFLTEFVEKISQIRDIYLMQKADSMMTAETALKHVKATEIGHANQQHELLPQFSSEVKENIDPIQRQYKKSKTNNKNKSHQVRQEDIRVGRNAQDLHSVGNYEIDFQQAVQSHHLGSSGVQNVHARIHGQTHDPMANYGSDFQQNVQSHHVGSPGIQNVQPQAGIYGQSQQTGIYGQSQQTGIYGQSQQTGIYGQSHHTGIHGQSHDHGKAAGSGFQHNQTHGRGDEIPPINEQLNLMFQHERAAGEDGQQPILPAVHDYEDIGNWLMTDEISVGMEVDRGLDVSDYLHGDAGPEPTQAQEQMRLSPDQLEARPISSANESHMLSESSPFPFDLHEFDNPSAWTLLSNVDQYDTESVVHQQHHLDKGKAKMGESSDLAGIKRKISDEDIEAKMEEVREEIAQMEKLKNYTEECLNKARESWEGVCKMLQKKKAKLEELEKENKRQKRQK